MGHRIGQWRAGGVDWYIMLNGGQWQHIRPCMAGGRRLVHGFRQQRIGRRWMGQQANCSEKAGRPVTEQRPHRAVMREQGHGLGQWMARRRGGRSSKLGWGQHNARPCFQPPTIHCDMHLT